MKPGIIRTGRTPRPYLLFALFLGVDLISLAMNSYVYRVDKKGDIASWRLLISGCVMVLVLLFVGLTLKTIPPADATLSTAK